MTTWGIKITGTEKFDGEYNMPETKEERQRAIHMGLPRIYYIGKQTGSLGCHKTHINPWASEFEDIINEVKEYAYKGWYGVLHEGNMEDEYKVISLAIAIRADYERERLMKDTLFLRGIIGE